jgi:hypothetical protein
MDDLEALKQLKARYFRLMDTKQWQAWGELFTADAEMRSSPDPDERFVGREEIVSKVSGYLADAVTVHHGHMPEIEIRGDTASGIWAMYDYVEMPKLVLRGWGHYHEEYVRDAGGWRIRRSRLTRLRLQLEPKEE